MPDRLNVGRLRRGFFKGLTRRSSQATVSDLPTVFLVVLLPIGLGIVSWVSGFRLVSPDSILAGLSLLTGGLLAAFAQIASWRSRLTERAATHPTTEASDREALDEAATDVLVASLASLFGVVAIVVGQSFTHDPNGALVGFFCGVIVATGAFVAAVFLMVVLRLYDAYTYLNRVSDRLNGSVRD